MAGKHVMLDILAQDADGQRFGVEMQLRNYLHWPQRNIYVASRALADQLRAGEHYQHLHAVIGISLLAHDLFTDRPERATWHFTLRDRELGEVESGETLQIHLIELRKAERLGRLSPALSTWIACLLHNLDEAAMNPITHPPVRQALKRLEELYSDEELRLIIQRREQALMDEQDALAWATQQGLQEGLQKGEQKGLQEGQQKGAASVLEGLLERRFGELSDAFRHRLRQASASQLQAWSLNVFDAQCLEDIFRL
ncbi:MAG: Rpn family recombination-promoting nuclease/putative transposase [Pigmentiphaga sp.]